MVNSSSRHLLDTCDKPDILHASCNHKPHHQHPSLQMGNEAKVGEHFAQGLAAKEWFNLFIIQSIRPAEKRSDLCH